MVIDIRNNRKSTLLTAILNFLSLSQFILQVLMYRMRKYPNILIRLLLTICIDNFWYDPPACSFQLEQDQKLAYQLEQLKIPNRHCYAIDSIYAESILS